MSNMATVSTCRKCGLSYRDSLIPHECAEWTKGRKEAKETQPMSDMLPEREDQMGQQETKHLRTCAIPDCPCREWSSQIAAAEESRRQREATTHQPAARGGGDGWRRYMKEAKELAESNHRIYGTQLSEALLSAVTATVNASLNQHQALVAERERLIIAARAVVERLADLPRYLEKNGTDTLATMTAECLADLAVAIPAEQRSTSE